MIPGGFSSFDDFEAFVARCRKLGISKITVGESEQRLSVELAPEYQEPVEPQAMTLDEMAGVEGDAGVNVYDDEDLFPGNGPTDWSDHDEAEAEAGA